MSPKTTSTCTFAADPSSFSRAFGSLLETSLTIDSWSARNSTHSSTNLPRRKTRTKARNRRRRRKWQNKLKMTSSPCNGRPTSSASHPADAHSHSGLTPPRSKNNEPLAKRCLLWFRKALLLVHCASPKLTAKGKVVFLMQYMFCQRASAVLEKTTTMNHKT